MRRTALSRAGPHGSAVACSLDSEATSSSVSSSWRPARDLTIARPCTGQKSDVPGASLRTTSLRHWPGEVSGSWLRKPRW